jgi:hypothetical protein
MARHQGPVTKWIGGSERRVPNFPELIVGNHQDEQGGNAELRGRLHCEALQTEHVAVPREVEGHPRGFKSAVAPRIRTRAPAHMILAAVHYYEHTFATRDC